MKWVGISLALSWCWDICPPALRWWMRKRWHLCLSLVLLESVVSEYWPETASRVCPSTAVQPTAAGLPAHVDPSIILWYFYMCTFYYWQPNIPLNFESACGRKWYFKHLSQKVIISHTDEWLVKESGELAAGGGDSSSPSSTKSGPFLHRRAALLCLLLGAEALPF